MEKRPIPAFTDATGALPKGTVQNLIRVGFGVRIAERWIRTKLPGLVSSETAHVRTTFIFGVQVPSQSNSS